MEAILASLRFFLDVRFVLLCGAGSLAGLFVGSIPGLSVSMATALLVSITYTWSATDAMATVMGVYVVGVFSGAGSASTASERKIFAQPSDCSTTIMLVPFFSVCTDLEEALGSRRTVSSWHSTTACRPICPSP